MAWRDFYNRDVFEHTHASTKPRYRRASYSVLGAGISCEIPPAELVQPRDRVAPNLATTILATARRNSLYPNLFVPGHPLSQNDARGKLERFSRATVRLLAFITPPRSTSASARRALEPPFRQLREKMT